MDYTRLGNSGLTVSRLCLGGNSWGARGHRSWAAFDAADSRLFFRRALDKGINFFDTSNTYSAGASEAIIGDELLSLGSRHEIVLSTKVGMGLSDAPNQSGLGRKHILESLDASLKRLKTEFVDILTLHRFDPLTPIDETLQTLDSVVQSGKVRYLAASTMRATQFARLQLTAKLAGMAPFISMQNLYNLIDRGDEADMIPFCREERVGLTPYSPLARGALARPVKALEEPDTTERSRHDHLAVRYKGEREHAIADRVRQVALDIGVGSGPIALAWLLSQDGVVAPVIGVTTLAQIDEAASAVELKLTDHHLALLSNGSDFVSSEMRS